METYRQSHFRTCAFLSRVKMLSITLPATLDGVQSVLGVMRSRRDLTGVVCCWLIDIGSYRRTTYICYRIIFIFRNTSLKTEVESFTNDHDSFGSFFFKWFDHRLRFQKILFLKFQGLEKF